MGSCALDAEDLDPVTFDLDKRLLQCDECGDLSTGRAEGWRLALDCDDELATFCRECWEREFEHEPPGRIGR